jgi:hypothetical protein
MAIHNAADNSFKVIFSDHRLFADFLRDFIDIDVLKEVKPEDIEDMRERFIPLFQDQKDSDTVKKINLKGETPFFIIAILEHESQVNFRCCFKMLYYVTLVLSEWEKEAERQKSGSSFLKDFKYPPVLPMILYDGKGPWTAERNFFNRTYLNTVFEKYIPKFEYELVNLNDYSEEDIMRFGGALSYIFLIDKIRISKKKDRISRLPNDYIESLRLQIPDDMNKLLADVTSSLLGKSSLGPEETEAAIRIIEKAKNKEYDGMFEAVLEDLKEAQEEAWEEGREEGWDKRGEEVARNALAEGLAPDFIQKITGLDMEAIKKLAQS